MGCYTELAIDPTTAAEVSRLRDQLRSAGVRGLDQPYLTHSHITLTDHTAELHDVDIGATLRDFASKQAPVSIKFCGLGMFVRNEQAVLYLAITPSAELLALQQNAHRYFVSRFGTGSEFQLPGAWVPHVTLGEEIPLQDLAIAVPIVAREFSFPKVTLLDEIVFDVAGEIQRLGEIRLLGGVEFPVHHETVRIPPLTP